MALHLEKGKAGEKQALEFLKQKGWKILEQNWRSGHREIDIIAESNGELVIVEVKVRKSIGGERLEEHFTPSKQQNLIRAAGAYIGTKKTNLSVRFDIILLTGEKGGYEMEHIENAFSAWD
jgi:putative endonuclease